MQKLIWINHSKAVLESSPGIDFWNCLKPVWEADWMAPLEIVLSDMPQPFLVHLLRPSVGQVWWRSARPTINTASELVLCFSPTNWICTWGCHGRFSLLFRDVIEYIIFNTKLIVDDPWWPSKLAPPAKYQICNSFLPGIAVTVCIIVVPHRYNAVQDQLALVLSSVAADACHSVHQFEPTANVLISALIVCWICASLLHHWGAEAVLEQKYWCTVTLNEKIDYASHLKPPKSIQK